MQTNVYKPSGKVAPAFFAYFLAVLLIGIPVLSVLYIYLIFYVPLIYVNIFITLGCGAALGFLVGHAAKLGKARNPLMVMLFAFLAMILLKYVQWAIYIPLVFTNVYEVFDWNFFERLVESAYLVLDPRAVWFGIDFINEFGVWAIGDSDAAVNNTMLWIVWAGEFLMMAVTAIAVAGMRPKMPFSEEHGAWYTEVRDTVVFFDPPEDVNGLREQVLAGNVTPLIRQVQNGLQEGALSHMRLNFHAPPEGSFSEPYFMTISSSVTTEKGRRRKRSETKAKTIARFVAVDRHKFRELTVPPIPEAPESVFDTDENSGELRFSLTTDGKDYANDEINALLFEEILDGLSTGTWDFMALTPNRPIQNSTYIQVALVSDEDFEINIGFGEAQTGYKMYRFMTEDKNLVLQYFVDYRDKQRIPDISSWEDISDTLPNES